MFGSRKDQKVEMLREVDLFRSFSDEDLLEVARRVDEVDAAAGDVLTRQGERGDQMLVIVEGSARVERDGQQLAVLGPSDVVGEMSLVDQRERTATVTATEPCRLLVMHRTDFSSLMGEVPWFARRVLESVVARLRETDEQLVG